VDLPVNERALVHRCSLVCCAIQLDQAFWGPNKLTTEDGSADDREILVQTAMCVPDNQKVDLEKTN